MKITHKELHNLLRSDLVNVTQIAKGIEMTKQGLEYHIAKSELPIHIEKKILNYFQLVLDK